MLEKKKFGKIEEDLVNLFYLSFLTFLVFSQEFSKDFLIPTDHRGAWSTKDGIPRTKVENEIL